MGMFKVIYFNAVSLWRIFIVCSGFKMFDNLLEKGWLWKTNSDAKAWKITQYANSLLANVLTGKLFTSVYIFSIGDFSEGLFWWVEQHILQNIYFQRSFLESTKFSPFFHTSTAVNFSYKFPNTQRLSKFARKDLFWWVEQVNLKKNIFKRDFLESSKFSSFFTLNFPPKNLISRNRPKIT